MAEQLSSFEGIELTADDESVIVNVLPVSGDPTLTGLDAPVGSLALSTNGNHYKKHDTGLTDWGKLGNTFGTEYEKYSDETVSSTTSTSYINKASFTTSVKPPGIYRINVSFFWNTSSTAKSFLSRFVFDGAVRREVVIAPSSTSGVTVPGTGSGQSIPVSFNLEETFNTETTHTLNLDWARENGGNVTASIWNVVLKIWKID